MPGDPKECRKNAADCKRLAKATDTPEAKEHFIRLAAQWERLAAELESADAFLSSWQDVSDVDRSTSKE